MSTATANWIDAEDRATVEEMESQEAIDDITKEPDINDHIGGNGAREDLDDGPSPEVDQVSPEGAPGTNGKPESHGKTKTRLNSEEREEQYKRIVREAIEEITPLLQQAVTLTHEQRDRYRQIGLIFNRKRDEMSNTYGTKLIGVLADHFDISVSSLRDMSAYAKVDPHGEAIPSTLIHLSWRRVVKCAKRAKEEDAFSEFLNGHSELVTLSTDEFDTLVRDTFPKKDTRGRKPKNKPLNTNKAENQANGLGDTDGLPKPSPARKLLPENVEKAKKALDELDADLSARIEVTSGENGFSFDATFTTEAECVTVFKHFINHLDKEAV